MDIQPSVTDLLDNISRLETSEFDVFFQEVLSLRARRITQVLPPAESILLQSIYQQLPQNTKLRYDMLTSKRQAETIQKEEYTELLKLVEIVEKHNVQRLKSLVELASLRNITVQELMKQLGLMPLHNA